MGNKKGYSRKSEKENVEPRSQGTGFDEMTPADEEFESTNGWTDAPNTASEIVASIDDGQIVEVRDEETGEVHEAEVEWITETDNGYLASSYLDNGQHADLKSDGKFTITSISERFVDDNQIDPETASVNDIIDATSYRTPVGNSNTEERFQEVAKQTAEAMKIPGMARKTFNHLEEVQGDGAGRFVSYSAGKPNREKAMLQLGTISSTRTISHELGHLIADSYGYGIGKGGVRNAKDLYDNEEDTFVPTSLTRDDLDEFLLTQKEGEDVPEEYDKLISEVNNSWKAIQASGQENEENLDDMVIHDNYCTTNSHELLAQMHQTFQVDSLPSSGHANWFYNHGELTKSYIEVFEPSDSMKELITYLHTDNPDQTPFDSDPYPEITPSV